MTESSTNTLRIGVTVGDPAGVGPEVILKALLGRGTGAGDELRAKAEFTLIGPEWVFQRTAELYGLRVAFASDPPTPPKKSARSLPILRVRSPAGCDEPFAIPYGNEDARCGRVALRAIEEAVRLIRACELDAMVTAPISKAAIHAAGSPYPGHTEMLQALAGSKEVGMLLVGGGLRVSLVTIHEALSSVPRLLTVERTASMIDLTHRFLQRWGIGKPRLALAAFNPHAGEGGLFGDEEGRILVPAVDRARKSGIQVAGPLPPDTVFHLALEGQFDAVVATYHDQALIPIKTLDFHGGVNVTMGLPFFRTSPDHGTAFGIAGKGLARPSSMRSAMAVAIDLVDKSQSTD